MDTSPTGPDFYSSPSSPASSRANWHERDGGEPPPKRDSPVKHLNAPIMHCCREQAAHLETRASVLALAQNSSNAAGTSGIR